MGRTRMRRHNANTCRIRFFGWPVKAHHAAQLLYNPRFAQIIQLRRITWLYTRVLATRPSNLLMLAFVMSPRLRVWGRRCEWGGVHCCAPGAYSRVAHHARRRRAGLRRLYLLVGATTCKSYATASHHAYTQDVIYDQYAIINHAWFFYNAHMHTVLGLDTVRLTRHIYCADDRHELRVRGP